MSEIAEQIQNPIILEPQVAEFPAPSLPQIPPQAPNPEVPQPDGASPYEVVLSAEIIQLWQIHQDCQSLIKEETEQFRSLRSELGKLLHQMKGLLARPGRNGEWSAWLRERQISRATADRLVLKFERSVKPDGNRLTEAITEPTEAEIQSLLDKVTPKLRPVLRTPASVYRFIDLLASSFELDRKGTEGEFVIVRPYQQSAVAESVQAESPVESAPVIVDAELEANSAPV